MLILCTYTRVVATVSSVQYMGSPSIAWWVPLLHPYGIVCMLTSFGSPDAQLGTSEGRHSGRRLPHRERVSEPGPVFCAPGRRRVCVWRRYRGLAPDRAQDRYPSVSFLQHPSHRMRYWWTNRVFMLVCSAVFEFTPTGTDLAEWYSLGVENAFGWANEGWGGHTYVCVSFPRDRFVACADRMYS